MPVIHMVTLRDDVSRALGENRDDGTHSRPLEIKAFRFPEDGGRVHEP